MCLFKQNNINSYRRRPSWWREAMLWTMGPRSELEIPKCLIPVPITLTGLSLVQRKPRCMPQKARAEAMSTSSDWQIMQFWANPGTYTKLRFGVGSPKSNSQEWSGISTPPGRASSPAPALPPGRRAAGSGAPRPPPLGPGAR